MPIWLVAIQWLSRLVLLILFILSMWSVATMLRCAKAFREANGDLKNAENKNAGENNGNQKSLAENDLALANQLIEKGDWNQFNSWAKSRTTLSAGTAQTILAIANASPSKATSSKIDRGVRSYLSREKTRLEEGLTVLATLGSNAPFIGLFGTVLGIIQAFGAMGSHQSNSTDIMIGISEALIAPAVGLFVAIPAVVAFNLFTRKLRVLIVNAEALKDHYLSKIGES